MVTKFSDIEMTTQGGDLRGVVVSVSASHAGTLVNGRIVDLISAGYSIFRRCMVKGPYTFNNYTISTQKSDNTLHNLQIKTTNTSCRSRPNRLLRAGIFP